jgi:molybdopterin-guanine dinucleotide biosynthesis protein A
MQRDRMLENTRRILSSFALIELHGKLLIQHVYENLSRILNSEFIFVVRKDALKKCPEITCSILRDYRG